MVPKYLNALNQKVHQFFYRIAKDKTCGDAYPTIMTYNLTKIHDSKKELIILNFVKTDDLIDNEYPSRKWNLSNLSLHIFQDDKD